MQLAVD